MPTSALAHASIHRPRAEEAPDDILRGVTKLNEELEKMSANYQDRAGLGVGIPAAEHRALIGRLWPALEQTQTKTNMRI